MMRNKILTMTAAALLATCVFADAATLVREITGSRTDRIMTELVSNNNNVAEGNLALTVSNLTVNGTLTYSGMTTLTTSSATNWTIYSPDGWLKISNTVNSGAATLYMQADASPDAGDQMALAVADGGGFAIQSDQAGAGTLATKLTIGNTGIVTLKGAGTIDNTTSATIMDLAETLVKVTGNFTVTGTNTEPIMATSTLVTNAFTVTSAYYGQLLLVRTNAACTITIATNAATVGSWFEVAVHGSSSDGCAPTITESAAELDTMIGPNSVQLDSVTWGTNHRIGAHAKFWSDGSFWHVDNLGGTTMTYTE